MLILIIIIIIIIVILNVIMEFADEAIIHLSQTKVEIMVMCTTPFNIYNNNNIKNKNKKFKKRKKLQNEV